MIILEIPKDNNMYNRHLRNIARNLRKPDYMELKSSAGRDPREVVLEAWNISSRRFMIMMYENNLNIPVAVFGVVSVKDKICSIGVPWLVGTSGIYRMKKFLYKNSKKYTKILMEGHDRLMNYVDKRNEMSIKWLKSCGFKFHDAEPYGAEKRLFYKFEMECV
jgi:hypothetical protein